MFCFTSSHFGQVRSYVDPRLFSKEVDEFPKRFGIQPYCSIRNSFNSLVRADKILNNLDLSDKVVMVTGGNSGLGNSIYMCIISFIGFIFVCFQGIKQHFR